MTNTIRVLRLKGQALLITAAFLLPSLTNAQQAGDLDITLSGDGIQTTAIGSGEQYAYSVAIQLDGKILVTGHSRNESNYIMATVRYNSDGTLDNTFGEDGIVATDIGSGSDRGNSITVQLDGKIIVAGTSHNGQNDHFAIARYNNDGTLDNTFSLDGIQTTDVGTGGAYGYAVAIQPDGKIVMTGRCYGGLNWDFPIVRFNSNGTLDNNFSGNGIQITDLGNDDYGNSIAIQPDGKMIVAGHSFNGVNYDFALMRCNSDGTIDNTFSEDGKQTTDLGSDDYGNSIAIQLDGKIVLAGYSNNGSNLDIVLVRYDSDGTLDNTLGGNGIIATALGTGDDVGNSVAIQPDGKIIVAGTSHNGQNVDFAVMRFNIDGTLDNTFSEDGKQTTAVGSGYDAGYSVALQQDGKIVLAGQSHNGLNTDFAIARYHGADVTGTHNLFSKIGIVVYPNPSNGLFNVVLDDLSGHVGLNVYDLYGREVLSQRLTVSSHTIHTIDLSSFATGVYTLLVSNLKSITTQKLVKQ